MPSFGLFTTSLQSSYLYGYIPRNVSFSGLVMDVDHLATQTHSKDNDWDKTVAFTKSSGMRASVMEHQVPEQMFSTDDAPAQGIGAVKALALASAEGQKIWTINQNNLDTALAAIDVGSDIESEIKNAVNAGKVATVHEKPVVFGSGTNVGYLLIDPDTGAGAYKISSGANGGYLEYYGDASGYISWTLFMSGLLLALVSNPAGWIVASLIICISFDLI